MRIFRTAAILCLGALLGAVVAYLIFNWYRGPQPVTRVNKVLKLNHGTPLLKPGQVLKWVGTDPKSGFSIVWLTPSPCEDNSATISSQLVNNVPTVTCRVRKGLPSEQYFQYQFGPQGPTGFDGGGGNPCYGCTSVSDGGGQQGQSSPQSQFDLQGSGVLLDGGPPGLVIVSCSNNVVKLTPSSIAADNVGDFSEVIWGQGEGATFLPDKPPTFDQAPNDQCELSAGAWACSFSTNQTYPVKATITVKADGCGSGTGTGTINGPTKLVR